MPDAQGNPTVADLATQSGASPFFANLAGTAMQGIDPFLSGQLGQSPATLAAIQAFQQQTLPVIQQQMQLQGLGQSPAVAQMAGSALGAQLPQLYQNETQNRLAALGYIPQLQAGMQAEQGLGLSQQELNLRRALGFGELGLGFGRLGLDTELGRGQLGLGFGRLGLDTQLGLGQLGLATERQAHELGPEFDLNTFLAMDQNRRAAELQSHQLGPEWDLATYLQLSGNTRENQALQNQAAVNAANLANQQAQLQLAGYGQAGQFLLGLGDLNNQAGQLQMQQQQQLLQGLSQGGALQQGQQQDYFDSLYQDYLRRQALSEQAGFGSGQQAFFPTTAFSNTESSKF